MFCMKITEDKKENLPHHEIVMKEQVKEENDFRCVSNTIRSHYAYSYLTHRAGIGATTQSN